MEVPRPSRLVRIAGFLCLAICYLVHASALSQEIFPTVTGQTAASDGESSQSAETVIIPGPLRSFLRMAGISQGITPDEVLPLLARNASLYGRNQGKETEFLVLLDRYVHQARDLQRFSANGTIRIAGCDDATGLVQALGYKFQQTCGQKNSYLVTANAERAFLTVDSGFPLTTLEEALQKNESFTYPFPTTRIPTIFEEKEWKAATRWKRQTDDDLVDILLHDQELDHLYTALAKCDRETRNALMKSPGLKRLMPLAAVFDLYGSQISIKSGRVIVPTGAEKSWEDLVGADLHSPGDFVTRLLSKDGGWLAAYFDVLSRLNQTQQAHLSEGTRLKRFYNAYTSTATRSSASTGVFPRNANLLVLLTSLKWEADGDLVIPGGLAVWEEILSQKAKSRETRGILKRSRGWDTSGRLLETLVASSSYESESGPAQTFLMLSAMNAGRPPERQLSHDTEKLVADRLSQFTSWFPILAEFPALDDTSIVRFLGSADRIDGISNPVLRANALGAFQANIGLWQIFARQGQIPNDKLNSSWQNAVRPFEIASSVQLFEAARSSLQSVLLAAAGNGNLSQDQIIDLLAGPIQDDPDSRRVHHELAEKIRAVLDDQRLVSLDTLFGLYDGMTDMAHGAPVGNGLLQLAGDLREFEMPRAIFTGNEKSSWAPAVYTSRHAELQIRTDLTRILRSSASPSQLEAARGQLTPFLRDTLVGLNYAYYEPPGAEILHNNPLFVRSHDFSSVSIQGVEQIWGSPRLIGVGATAGGGAYLMGSLADLPYTLASAEGDFIAPKNIQALIWKEVAPDLLVDATLPRWWAVSRNELHSVALYQRCGEELLSASQTNPDLQAKVIEILADRMPPGRLDRTVRALQTHESMAALISELLPADTFYLAFEFRKRYPQQAPQLSQAGQELEDLSRKYPSEASWERLSADFGVPHPALVLTNSRALLNMKPPSAFGGNASRLLAESWESNNLYWARLADEKGYSPVMLNLLIPALTRHMIANIFASNIDDWPALLRAMEETGNEFRQGKIGLEAVIAIARQ
jgi:hypothetical protein